MCINLRKLSVLQIACISQQWTIYMKVKVFDSSNK